LPGGPEGPHYFRSDFFTGSDVQTPCVWHKNKALQDDPKTIDETRRYLEDAERLISSSHTAREFYDAMLKL